MNLLIKSLRYLRYSDFTWKATRLLSKVTFGILTPLHMHYARMGFNRKLDTLLKSVCKHPNTFESHDWGGGFVRCRDCNKTLKKLWFPTVSGIANAGEGKSND